MDKMDMDTMDKKDISPSVGVEGEVCPVEVTSAYAMVSSVWKCLTVSLLWKCSMVSLVLGCLTVSLVRAYGGSR